MLSITQPMRLNRSNRVQPRYFYTPIPIHLSKQLARTKTAPITGTSFSRQTGFSMDESKPAGRTETLNQRETPQRTQHYGDYRI